MGHTQYQIQYKDLPLLYRDGANPGKFCFSLAEKKGFIIKTKLSFRISRGDW